MNEVAAPVRFTWACCGKSLTDLPDLAHRAPICYFTSKSAGGRAYRDLIGARPRIGNGEKLLRQAVETEFEKQPRSLAAGSSPGMAIFSTASQPQPSSLPPPGFGSAG